MIALRWLLTLFFVAAGINHVVSPGFYRPMMPPWLPWPDLLIAVSGVAEIIGGIGVLLPSWRRAAGWGLLALLVAVFPANLQIAMHGHPDISTTVAWWRLPFQGLFIAWVWWVCLRRPMTPPHEGSRDRPPKLGLRREQPRQSDRGWSGWE